METKVFRTYSKAAAHCADEIRKGEEVNNGTEE